MFLLSRIYHSLHHTTLGVDYEDRVLPSITNEVLKAAVAEFDACELIIQREVVSARYVESRIDFKR